MLLAREVCSATIAANANCSRHRVHSAVLGLVASGHSFSFGADLCGLSLVWRRGCGLVLGRSFIAGRRVERSEKELQPAFSWLSGGGGLVPDFVQRGQPIAVAVLSARRVEFSRR